MSFVGSNTSNMGAKNHGIVMPEANKDATLNALVAAGQRCMALSTIVFAGDSESWGLQPKQLHVYRRLLWVGIWD
ncbi:hypothetical protein V6Z11_A13G054300 [Gossypium hirsutum]